jgi:hypothetical protein
MNYVGTIDFHSIRVLSYFYLTLLDRIFLIDATFNGFIEGINVEQLGAVHSLKFQTTDSIIRACPSQQVLVLEARCTGDTPRLSSSQATSHVLLRIRSLPLKACPGDCASANYGCCSKCLLLAAPNSFGQ